MQRLGLLVVVLACGCGRTVTEDDCKRIGDNIQEVWNAEATAVTPTDPTTADRAAHVIKSEGEKVHADWEGQCKKELLGRRVDPKEVDCLVSAKTVAAVNHCAEL